MKICFIRWSKRRFVERHLVELSISEKVIEYFSNYRYFKNISLGPSEEGFFALEIKDETSQ